MSTDQLPFLKVVNDTRNTLLSTLMEVTAALNSSNLCIPIFMDEGTP